MAPEPSQHRSIDPRPGTNAARLVALMRAAVDRCELDLSGLTVLTEAATGPYAVTPVLAAMAGAERVFAMTRASRFGSVAQVTEETLALANLAGVAPQISVITEKTPDVVRRSDIITNSGHLRPIDAQTVEWMKDGAVVPLMYEAWEFRPTDVDLGACRRRGILFAGTNERHPAVNVFSYLGVMAVKLLLDAGVAVYGCDLLVLCDNAFGSFIADCLPAAGAQVEMRSDLEGATGPKDAILVALQPRADVVLGAREARMIAERWPGAVVAQYWGDVDRAALAASDVPVWPLLAPAAGHMGVLPSAVGPEPVVRLQCGGLKVGQVLAHSSRNHDADWMNSPFVQVLHAEGC